MFSVDGSCIRAGIITTIQKPGTEHLLEILIQEIQGTFYSSFMLPHPLDTVNRPWRHPPHPLHLLPHDIHVWKIPLHPPLVWVNKLWNLLDLEEQQRAERYKTPALQEAFVTGRGGLRLILHRYLDTEPDHVKFATEQHGKPYVAEPSTSPPLSFNLAHSGELALLAVTLTRKVGIDIERHRRPLNYAGLVQRMCSPQEQAFLGRISHEQRQTAFLTCWTRKEAYVKATGMGITFPLNTVTVSLAQDAPPALLHVERNEEEPSRWAMRDLYPGHGYTAALVGEGHDWTHSCWEWTWSTPP